MRLYHPQMSDSIAWHENKVPVLVAENSRLFMLFVNQLSMQSEGEKGPFVLSYEYEPVDIAEHVIMIRDYLYLPVDDRKLQNRFQTLLQSVVMHELQDRTASLQREISEYLEQVCLHMDYPTAFSEGEYVLPLLKSLKLKPAIDGVTPLERLIQYMELYNGLIKDQIFVLVGAHAYFSDDEISQLYKMAAYERWRMMLIERYQPNHIDAEEIYLFDENLCELRVDLS